MSKEKNPLERGRASKELQPSSVMALKYEAHYQKMKVQRGPSFMLDKQEHMPSLRNI